MPSPSGNKNHNCPYVKILEQTAMSVFTDTSPHIKTIAFTMDCNTTKIEPNIALVKHNKLVGGDLLLHKR
jgi:hypothetical protein